MNVDKLADAAFQLWGLHGTSLIATLVLLSMVSQLIARLIPEDSTGWKRVARQIAKVIGLYASNRITAGITATDVVKAAVHSGAVSVESVQQAKNDIPPEPVLPDPLAFEPEPEVLELTPDQRQVIPAFPDFQRPQEAPNFTQPQGESQ